MFNTWIAIFAILWVKWHSNIDGTWDSAIHTFLHSDTRWLRFTNALAYIWVTRTSRSWTIAWWVIVRSLHNKLTKYQWWHKTINNLAMIELQYLDLVTTWHYFSSKAETYLQLSLAKAITISIRIWYPSVVDCFITNESLDHDKFR